MSTGSGGERPHTTDGAIAYKLWLYKISVYHGLIRAGRDVDCLLIPVAVRNMILHRRPLPNLGSLPGQWVASISQ